MDTAKEMGLTAEADFVLRVVQMSELLAIRHCIFLMGPTGVGRTEAYRVLAKSMEKGVDGVIVNDYLRANNKRKITIRDINPKSVSTQEFYGYVNLATREWKDGLMSYYMRELANVPNEARSRRGPPHCCHCCCPAPYHCRVASLATARSTLTPC